jgi:hypothetical protein
MNESRAEQRARLATLESMPIKLETTVVAGGLASGRAQRPRAPRQAAPLRAPLSLGWPAGRPLARPLGS